MMGMGANMMGMGGGNMGMMGGMGTSRNFHTPTSDLPPSF
jgi:hypothetical protein